MRVKIIKCSNPQYWYAKLIGKEVEVEQDDEAPNEWTETTDGWNLLKSDCTIIPDETVNRVSFNYEIWKEKGGKVWCVGKEVTQLMRFEVELGAHKYAGVMDGILKTFSCEYLTMSAPDEVYYVNKYKRSISKPYRTIENAKYGNTSNALHILEINITKGTNKIVHTYNEKV